MRKTVPEKLEAGRFIDGWMASDASYGFYGAFEVQGPCGAVLRIVASGGDADPQISEGWEHVSISTHRRPPNWQEMCFVKALFWESEECVLQFHPPESSYVNNHPHCLHLWKPPYEVRLPPSILVGIKTVGDLSGDPTRARAMHEAITDLVKDH